MSSSVVVVPPENPSDLVPVPAPPPPRRRRIGRRRVLRASLVAVAVAIVAGTAVQESLQAQEAPPAGSALAALAALAVRDDGAATGYERALFGDGWQDLDGDGCDTRDAILARDLHDVTFSTRGEPCQVRTGTLEDPYTGTTVAFRRGNATSAAVQVDHVVPLLDAWRTGAAGWDETTRTAFANDPLNLLAADGPTHRSKGARDAAAWLPPAHAARCPYVARQVAVKARYGLAVDPAEREAMERVLQSCPAEPLPLG